MTQLTANVSPLIPFQFPIVYRDDGPNLVAFVQAYYQWMEQEGNAQNLARNYYNIKDIDNTLEAFIVYFKEKYLVNIQFQTETDIRTVVKHALDIYRSKGTERGTTLLFQLAFNETPQFYYPSIDLFKLSDGQWIIQKYIELSLQENNVLLQDHEIMGTNSGAIAFVDRIVRRITNGRLEDVAYISAINGVFEVGEIIITTDMTTLTITQGPTILGSLNAVDISVGSGDDYIVGSNIPVDSYNGVGASVRVAQIENSPGSVSLEFEDGGYGYSFTQTQANISYNKSSGTMANGTNIYTYYANGSISSIGNIISAVAPVSNAGVMTVQMLQGNLVSGNLIYSFANALHSNITSFSLSYIAPTLYVSNAMLTISNLLMNTTNNECGQFFNWLDPITQPLATLNYIQANGSFLPGSNIYTWANSITIAGQGVVIDQNQTNSTAGVLVVSVLSGNLQNSFYSYTNTVGANLAASNGYTNTSASGIYIANTGTVVLNITGANGAFIGGELCYQQASGPSVFPDNKTGGWGIIEDVVNSSSITVNSVVGRFIPSAGELLTVLGSVSGAEANVVSVDVNIGVVNTSGSFIPSPYSYIYSPLANGVLSSVYLAGSNLSITVVPTLLYPQAVSLNTDIMSTYAGVYMNATAYGFPGNPLANATSGSMASCMNMLQTTVGKITNAIATGIGTNFNETPLIVLDDSLVSNNYVYNDILWVVPGTGQFEIGELINQAATGARGVLMLNSNTTFLELQRLNYSNDFIATNKLNNNHIRKSLRFNSKYQYS
jgi:hypothetical protein